MADNQQQSMKYTRLGKSGLKVSRIILGLMSFGDPKWLGWVIADEEKALEQIKAAYDLGINTFDTANVYSNGASETLLGKAIKKFNLPREEIVVMTKFYWAVGRDTGEFTVLLSPDQLVERRYINQHGASRKHIFDSVKNSLKRLQLDYIDVLQCHRFDYNTPIEETMQALHDVVKAGYVRYIGMSSCWAWQFHKMQNYAINNGLTPFISMQSEHSAVYREEEREKFPLLKDLGVGTTPYATLSRGFLTRPMDKINTTTRSQDASFKAPYIALDWEKEPMLKEINQRVEAIAKARGITMAQVAIAWSLTRVDAPIIGCTSTESLKDTVASVHVQLTEEEIKSIEEPYVPRAIRGFV